MDVLISTFAAEPDADLMLCPAHGVAYQADMAARRSYDTDYLAKVDGYEDTLIARKVIAGRLALIGRHLPYGARVLDVGAGSGAFVRAAHAAGYYARGYEVIAAAATRLRLAGLYAGRDPEGYDAVTLWDTLEHMPDPGAALASVPAGAFLFVSIPVFPALGRIRESRHYRPGEHLYYWSPAGFVAWAERYGFRLLETSAHETEAGRDSIGAFALRRSG